MIIKPENMDFSNKNIIMIISGLPGVGKTTLALSAPGCLLVDADEGVVRVKPEHRKDAIIAKTYEELLEDIKSVGTSYKTIIIDTGGALIDLMKDWAIRNEPTASKKNGGFAIQGYGYVKTEFLRLSAELRRNYNVIFLFHVNKENNDENIFFDIVCEGSARNLVYQPADLCGYLHIINGDRFLGFTPTMNYNAKAAYGIKGLVKIPELSDGEPNDFLTRLFDRVKANIKAEGEALKPQQENYEQILKTGNELIEKVVSPGDIVPTSTAIKALPQALTSQKELLAALKNRAVELGFIWNKEKKEYEQVSDNTDAT